MQSVLAIPLVHTLQCANLLEKERLRQSASETQLFIYCLGDQVVAVIEALYVSLLEPLPALAPCKHLMLVAVRPCSASKAR